MTYFDHNATTPLHPDAQEEWLRVQKEFWYNPSSPNTKSAATRNFLKELREYIAKRFQCDVENVIFNSGASEGNTHVLQSFKNKFPKKKILVSALEHSSVLNAAKEIFGENRILIPVTKNGSVCLDALKRLIEDESPSCLSILAVSNETGVIQPIPEISKICVENEVLFHCDASQLVGKLPLELVGESDIVTFCAHKFGGPKGVGAIVSRRDGILFSSIFGGEQEQELRAGTEDLASIASMVTALRALKRLPSAFPKHKGDEYQRGRDAFEKYLKDRIPEVMIAGENEERVWNTSCLIMPAFENTRWVTLLEKEGFIVSTGSACSTSSSTPSTVLQAMSFSETESKRAVRVSSGWGTTEDEWLGLAKAFINVYGDLKRESKKSLTTVIDID